MFCSSLQGSDESQGECPTSTAFRGVRDLGISALGGGLWSLPQIAAEVPTELAISDVCPLISFGLAAHDIGLRFPREPFTTAGDALAAQIKNLPVLKALSSGEQPPRANMTCCTSL